MARFYGKINHNHVCNFILQMNDRAVWRETMSTVKGLKETGQTQIYPDLIHDGYNKDMRGMAFVTAHVRCGAHTYKI